MGGWLPRLPEALDIAACELQAGSSLASALSRDNMEMLGTLTCRLDGRRGAAVL